MKLSNEQLKEIIKEELQGVLMELHNEEPGYTLWSGSEHIDLPMDMPEGLPADLMLKLKQLAIDDPAHASELAAGLVPDDEKAREVSDYLYDIAIAHLTKNSGISAIVDVAKIFIYEEEEGELFFANDFPRTAPRSEIYEYIQELIKNPLT